MAPCRHRNLPVPWRMAAEGEQRRVNLCSNCGATTTAQLGPFDHDQFDQRASLVLVYNRHRVARAIKIQKALAANEHPRPV